MIRHGRIYSIDEVLSKVVMSQDPNSYVGRMNSKVDFDGDRIKMSSLRLKLFHEKGIRCVVCGIEGEYFVKEKHTVKDTTYHFNLYGTDDQGKEVLITKDHIIPISKGGKDHISNFQVMCTNCNLKKGNKE